ncbi:Glycerol 3-phosphate/dihydroxyacetone phosphate sn-1 acyltransferase [Saccharomyces cerevisiae]|nr:Glycerol 3-phosphate/dihydroxyacetone phosphate sn-1 acyltransferase [Saccharomyces boulardii (nom. inval.)]
MPAPKLTEKSASSKSTQKTTNYSSIEAKSVKTSADQAYIYQEPSATKKILYSIATWLLYNIFHCFFREIRGRGSFKVPQQGPVIFVAAPHANQFVDPVILMGEVKKSVNRRVSFLIAESSLKQPAIGFLASFFMAIGVVRPQDNLKPAEGTIRVDPTDYKRVIGHDTHFLTDCMPKGLIGLPKSMGFGEIQSIESDTSLTLRKSSKWPNQRLKPPYSPALLINMPPKSTNLAFTIEFLSIWPITTALGSFLKVGPTTEQTCCP